MNWFAQRSQTPLWGDGFDTDTFHDLVSLKDWELLSSDEMIRVFPRLASKGGIPAPAVIDRLHECVAVLAWCLRDSGGASRRGRQPDIEDVVGEPKSVTPHFVATTGRDGAARWFCGRRWPKRNLVGLAARHAPDLDRYTQALALIDDIASEIGRGNLRAYDSRTAAEIAYWTGIHPIYLWPDALLSNAFYTSVGWIGHAERYGQAFMTRDIADYFMSALVMDGMRKARVLDTRLQPYLRSARDAALIFGSARRCLRGSRPIIRLAPNSDKAWPSQMAASFS
jgi:hypothetical protein